MKAFKDYKGRSVRLTDERRKHILDHPEMKQMTGSIGRTLAAPQQVIQSISDKEARLYYRYYLGTKVGGKYLCVVVKIFKNDAFVLTAYLTDTIKKGELIWLRK